MSKCSERIFRKFTVWHVFLKNKYVQMLLFIVVTAPRYTYLVHRHATYKLEETNISTKHNRLKNPN